jgi:signal recognition particle subunit SRP54
LGAWIKETHKKKVMVVSTDVYRPAAILQLAQVAEQTDLAFFPSQPDQKPVNIAKDALAHATLKQMDVLIVDTAGRLHIDESLMGEIKDISQAVSPSETLFVLDSMAGQDALHTARAFHDALALTGTFLTKTDGDGRGGAALSARFITDTPIKFIGTGEKLNAIEPFYPDRMASRILDMGDIVSLVEQAQRSVDDKHAKKIEKQLAPGKRFDFNDLFDQLKQMDKMGGMEALMSKLPGQMAPRAQGMLDAKTTKNMKAIIQSMTPKERKFPNLMNNSRKQRLARGSGTIPHAVSQLFKQFTQMQKMMRRMKGTKMAKRLKHMQSQMPAGPLKGLPEDPFK